MAASCAPVWKSAVVVCVTTVYDADVTVEDIVSCVVSGLELWVTVESSYVVLVLSSFRTVQT